jgi:hypothetical protein
MIVFLQIISQKAFVTKGSMINIILPGGPPCYFCEFQGSAQHIFFRCAISKPVCRIIDKYQGSSSIFPLQYYQCLFKVKHTLPKGDDFFVSVLAIISAPSGRVIDRNRCDLLCFFYFLLYWSVLGYCITKRVT